MGEVAPPYIQPLLAHLGLWDEFAAAGHRASYRTVSAWGQPGLTSNEFLFHAHQVGWRLERGDFDCMLRRAASARVASAINAKVTRIARPLTEWQVFLSDGTTLAARYVVDATGTAAALARRCGLRAIASDRLVGCSLRTGSLSDGSEGLMIEAVEHGWWYSAATPGARVVAFMTDADRLRPLGLLSAASFRRLAENTRYIRQVADLDHLHGRPMTCPASSRFIETTPAVPLLCVGDAAIRYDPLSGQGIAKALQSGIFAAYAIADSLLRGDARGLSRYRLMLQRDFGSYRQSLHEYYATERRWPNEPFWQRRHQDLPRR
ncbi:hypothetical protein WS62_04985 [Burkholderia sp. ABCPW 14]|nr:hypothetical protein WS62_04985 [Burkholderia sp. ABCPW 14]